MIGILCPSRGRPEKLQRLIDSVARTSIKAKVVAWIDEDQSFIYRDVKGMILESGSGRPTTIEAMNRLAHHHREFRVYGMVPDDAYMVTPGWDDWTLSQFDTFPNDVGVVSPHHTFGEYIDMPFVSRNWIDGLGYFAYPHCYHYCWTLVTGLLGEATSIVYAPENKFHITHEHVDSPQMAHYDHDATSFFNHFMLEHRNLIERLRRAECPSP